MSVSILYSSHFCPFSPDENGHFHWSNGGLSLGHRWSHLCGPVRCSTQPSIALQDAQVWRVLHVLCFGKTWDTWEIWLEDARTLGNEWNITSRIFLCFLFFYLYLFVCVMFSNCWMGIGEDVKNQIWGLWVDHRRLNPLKPQTHSFRTWKESHVYVSDVW